MLLFRDLLPIPNILRDNGIFLEKHGISLNLTFDGFFDLNDPVSMGTFNPH